MTSASDISGFLCSSCIGRPSRTYKPFSVFTISSGFAERRPGETGHSVMERADAALYTSKRGGRNRVTAAESKPDSANAA